MAGPGNESDIVVIGAGHNALIAACYLAKAGLSVTVVEARDMVGGGTVTEELTVPGFRHDPFSQGHPFFLTNPVMTADELGIVAKGLRYVGNDPILVVPFPDGESITFWRDKQRTAAELARFSAKDAAAFLALYDEHADFLPLQMAQIINPPDRVPPAADPAAEARYRALGARSARDVVYERFESEHARDFMLWFPLSVTQPWDTPGTGLMPLLAPARWEQGWAAVIGGSGVLAEELAAALVRAGGRVVTGARVKRIRTAGGRADSVECENGMVFRARRAVVTSTHYVGLPQLIDAKLPEAFVAGTKTWRAGPSLFVVHLALPRNQRIRTRDGSVAGVLAGQSNHHAVARQLVDLREGRLTLDSPWMLCGCSSLIDPSRAPEGRGTAKVLTNVPYALDGDPANWTEAAKNEYADFLVAEYAKLVVDFAPGDELGRAVHSPVDIELINPNFHRGHAQGGELVPEQMGLNRPVKGWGNYRMPVPGLYLTGLSSHPGGPVTGWSGRHAARAVLEDLQIDWRRVMPTDGVTGTFEVPVIDTSTM